MPEDKHINDLEERVRKLEEAFKARTIKAVATVEYSNENEVVSENNKDE